jgi:rhodanese-related sulfurtransferase
MVSKLLKGALAAALVLGVSAQAAEKKKNILKSDGVKITYQDSYGEDKNTAIKRIHDPVCADKSKVNGMIPDTIWKDDYANESVPDECKKTFVTTIGKISPIKMDGIDTFGELEVIEFIKKAQNNEDMILVDARMAEWYAKRTIPTAVNLPYKSFNPKSQDFEIVMDAAGVSYEDGVYDFSDAKTMLLFCNGAWCPQSTWAIENLLKIGYPKEKLGWYRSGMYGWTMLNLTTIKP